jgi:hypothetical protein
VNIDQIKNISTLSLNSTSEKELDINDIEKLMGSYMDGSMGVSQTKEALLDLLEGLGIEPIDALKVVEGRSTISESLLQTKIDQLVSSTESPGLGLNDIEALLSPHLTKGLSTEEVKEAIEEILDKLGIEPELIQSILAGNGSIPEIELQAKIDAIL